MPAEVIAGNRSSSFSVDAPPPIADPALESAQQLQAIRAILIEIRDSLAAGEGAEGLGPVEAAAFVGVSRRSWDSMNANALCPLPSYAGDRSPRWSKTELRAWIIDRMPARSKWESRRKFALKRVA